MVATPGGEAGGYATGQRTLGVGGQQVPRTVTRQKPTHLCQVVPRLGNSRRVEDHTFRMDSA